MGRPTRLDERMKLYEGQEAGRRLLPLLPVLARLDGRSFHNFTKDMQRPYDSDFLACRIDTLRALMLETGALAGYTQSDEITLLWHSTTPASQIWFDGRVCKMVSQLAAQATLHFYRAVQFRMPQFADRLPTFDARVWTVPTRAEAANVFLWREQDATRNSLSMLAQQHFSSKELHGKHGPELHEMLYTLGINWNDYPAEFKRGVYMHRRTERVPYSAAELEALPPMHAARKDPTLTVERSVVRIVDMPPISRVPNREAVLFSGADPVELRSNEPISDREVPSG